MSDHDQRVIDVIERVADYLHEVRNTRGERAADEAHAELAARLLCKRMAGESADSRPQPPAPHY